MTEETATRLAKLRATSLKDDECKLLSDVETYGWHVIHVGEADGIPGWSYTVGVYETTRQPELVIVGLDPDVAHFVLNEAACLMERGVSFEVGHRERDLLEGVECEFKAVEKRWFTPLLGYARWFYDGDEFPVLQCVYPDLKNKFPWESGFDDTWRSRQALLFSPDLWSGVEQDLWAANDPTSSIFDWKFEDLPHTGVYTTRRIMNREEPILYASHDREDGAWQFHGPSEPTVETGALVCFHHILDIDGSIKQLADLPLGWCAWRESVSDAWTRKEKKNDV